MDAQIFDFSIISFGAVFILLAFAFAGVVDSTCGGGGLISLPAMMFVGMPSHMVVGTGQCVGIFGCLTAFVEYARSGKCDFSAFRFAIIPSIIGACIGSKLNLVMDEHILELVMLFIIPFLVLISILKPDVGTDDRSADIPRNRAAVYSALIGLVISTYHSFYGPASGVFFLIAFTTLLKFDAAKANGTARLIILCIDITSSIIYAVNGLVHVKVAIVGVIGYSIGSYIGAGLAISRGSKYIRPVYYAVLVAMLIKLTIKLI